MGNDTSKVQACISDSSLAALPLGARGTNPPATWPVPTQFNEVRQRARRPPARPARARGVDVQFACPASAYLTDTCPANFHVPAGVSPYKDW